MLTGFLSWNYKGIEHVEGKEQIETGVVILKRIFKQVLGMWTWCRWLKLGCGMVFMSIGKAVPLQAWSGPEGSRKLRFPDYMTTAQDGGKVVSLRHRPPLPQVMLLVLISVRGWVDPRAIVRSEGFYVDEKFQWHQLGSNQRPSDL